MSSVFNSSSETLTDEPAVYVGTYAKYNTGNLSGAWLKLDDYANRDEFYAAAKALHSDEEDAELMFQDWQSIPEQMIGESHIDEEVWEWIELDEDEKMLLKVYLDHVDQNGDIEKARESFQGKFDNEDDWAAQHWEETGLLESIPESLRSYIDYEQFARDARLGGDMTFIRYEGDIWAFQNI